MDIIAYHGSPNGNIKKIDILLAGSSQHCNEKALYFTDNIEVANRFSKETIQSGLVYDMLGDNGHIYKVKLHLDKVLDFRCLNDTQIKELYKFQSDECGFDTKEEFVKKMLVFKEYHNHQMMKFVLDFEKLSKEYDGFIAEMGKGYAAIEYGVFNSSSIVEFCKLEPEKNKLPGIHKKRHTR